MFYEQQIPSRIAKPKSYFDGKWLASTFWRNGHSAGGVFFNENGQNGIIGPSNLLLFSLRFVTQSVPGVTGSMLRRLIPQEQQLF